MCCMPALYLGVPVVACRFKKFTAEAAFQLLQDQKIRNTFLPPTALKMMRQVDEPEKTLAASTCDPLPPVAKRSAPS